jgi:hypothetical protein
MSYPHLQHFFSGKHRRTRNVAIIALILLTLVLGGTLLLTEKATMQAEMDFGDAPQPTYPTTLALNGAFHQVQLGFSLGPSIDAEPDGQPSILADGDDLLASDDEDGITFVTALIPGMQACIHVNLTNTASVSNPALDGWIDFDGDGIWAHPGEHLWGGASQTLTAGTTVRCFNVPLWASRGPTYARFRLSDGGNMVPDGPGPAGEVEDYKVYIEFTKWEQPPTKKNPQDACYWGWDEVSIYGAEGSSGYPIIADDWECRDGRPVTDIHWWGSYEGWFNDTPPFDPPPPQYRPTQFHIGIWQDVPANPPGTPFSHPADLIKEWIVNYSDISEIAAGCDFYATMQTPDTCYHYDFEIPQGDWFFQDPGASHVYWLSIAAIYPNNEPPQQYRWGWKTRKPEWNDDAVRIFTPDAPHLGDFYVDGEPIETQEEGSWDTSFILTALPTQPNPPTLDIAIDTIPTTARLFWPHVQVDIMGAAITVNRYYLYRDTSPYQGTSATLLSVINGPFLPGNISFLDPNAIGNASQNYYYYLKAATSDRYGGDTTSILSNHVAEFDFTLVPGS